MSVYYLIRNFILSYANILFNYSIKQNKIMIVAIKKQSINTLTHTDQHAPTKKTNHNLISHLMANYNQQIRRVK